MNTAKHTALKILFGVVILPTMFMACSDDPFGGEKHEYSENMLSIIPYVDCGNSELAEAITRASGIDYGDTSEDNLSDENKEGDDDLNENTLEFIDVYVEDVTNGHSDSHTFLKHYKVPNSFGTSVLKDQDNQLAVNWKSEGLRNDGKYNIYVTANNTAFNSDDITTVAQLKAHVTTDANIFRSYNVDDQYYNDPDNKTIGGLKSYYFGYDPDKKFHMTGFLKEWTPEKDESGHVKAIQHFNVPLERSAVKIVYNVHFNDDFKVKMDEDKLESGMPQWRYDNFMEMVKDFPDGYFNDDSTAPYEDPDLMENRATQRYRYDPTRVTGSISTNTDENNVLHKIDNRNFQIITYSYPYTWDKETSLGNAPNIIISFQFSRNGDVVSTNYYRLPVVNEAEYDKLERNHLYVIDAEINGYGSATDVQSGDTSVVLRYQVLPWLKSSIGIKGIEMKYLLVEPKQYTLHGDNLQVADLNYYAPKLPELVIDTSSPITVTYVNQNGTTVNVANITASNVSTDGSTLTYTYNNPNSSSQSTDKITIDRTAGNRKIKIESYALASRAVKTIKFRVRVKGTDLYEDIVIKHFPLDNIQNIAGSWSSRWYTEGRTGVSTTDKSVADGWGTGYETVKTGTGVYVNYKAWLADPDHISREVQDGSQADDNSDHYAYWYYDRNYRSEETAIEEDNGWYYWATGRQEYTANYHRARYERTTTTYYQVGRNYNTWVEWGKTAAENRGKYTRSADGNFVAKVYYEGSIYPIMYTSTSNWTATRGRRGTQYDNAWIYALTEGNTYISQEQYNGSTLTNNHMYVIQVSSTSDKYVLGRPIIPEGSNTSNDHVVSPAFMIASQLGAVGNFSSGEAAAAHCRKYMEVGLNNNKKYTGWRLPTAEEIQVIIDYQKSTSPSYNVTMTQVLGGQTYYNLTGRTSETGTNQNVGSTFVRCVRDLSEEEINEINGE